MFWGSSKVPQVWHAPRAMTGTDAIDIIIDISEIKTLKSVMGSGRVGSGRAANTQIFPLNTKELAPLVTIFTRVGGGVTTFAHACPVSLSRKPMSPGMGAAPKTDLSLSRSLVHRQTWRLTGL